MTEYDDLLTEVRAKAEAYRSSAKEYIPKMYTALRNENQSISPSDVRDRIEKDCVVFWSRRTILDALPNEAKDPKNQEMGRLGQKKHKSAAVSAAPTQQESLEQVMIGAKGTQFEGPKVPSYNHESKHQNKSGPELGSTYSLAGRQESESQEPSQEIKLLKNRIIQVQEQHTKDTNKISELEAALAEATKFIHADQIPRVQTEPSYAPFSKKRDQLDFEFSIPFEDLRLHMEQIFKKDKGLGMVSFRGIMNFRTGKVIHVSFGSNTLTTRWH